MVNGQRVQTIIIPNSKILFGYVTVEGIIILKFENEYKDLHSR